MSLTRFDFIELVYEYPLYLPIPEKEDYFHLPVSIAQEMGLRSAIFTSRTKLNQQKKDVVKGIDVFRFDSIVTMLRTLIKSQPTLVFGHSFGWMPAMLAPFLSRKYIFTPHIYKLDIYPKWKVDSALSLIKKSSMLKVSTNFEASQFQNVIPQSRINIIPHPIDYDFFSKTKDDDESKQINEIYSTSEKLILCVSNLFPTKNLETLIRSFASIRNRIPSIKLLIVGGKPKTTLGLFSSSQANWNYQLKLMHIANSLGINEDVVFTGYKGENELRDYYRIADVFCLPSKKECQSLAAGEAASSGLPLVLSNLEPLMEIYKGCALFQKPLDHKKLSSNIIDILENPKLAKTLGNEGHSKMLDYHPNRIRAKLKKLYSKLLLD